MSLIDLMCVVQRFTLDTCVKDRPEARFTRPATCMSPSKMSPLNVASKCHHFMSPFGRHLRGSRPSLKCPVMHHFKWCSVG